MTNYLRKYQVNRYRNIFGRCICWDELMRSLRNEKAGVIVQKVEVIVQKVEGSADNLVAFIDKPYPQKRCQPCSGTWNYFNVLIHFTVWSPVNSLMYIFSFFSSKPYWPAKIYLKTWLKAWTLILLDLFLDSYETNYLRRKQG